MQKTQNTQRALALLTEIMPQDFPFDAMRDHLVFHLGISRGEANDLTAAFLDSDDEGCDECMTFPCSCDVLPEVR